MMLQFGLIKRCTTLDIYEISQGDVWISNHGAHIEMEEMENMEILNIIKVKGT